MTAQFELRVEQMTTKLQRQDALLASYDSDLLKMNEYKASWCSCFRPLIVQNQTLRLEATIKELEQTIVELKVKLGEQKNVLQKLNAELEEQKQLWFVFEFDPRLT